MGYLRWAAICCISVMLCEGGLYAQEEHHHKPEHMALHLQFYQNWFMPDNRGVSCCHNEDCEPAEAYQKDGVWYARKTSEVDKYPDYVPIPPNKVETERDSPDGRSHMCGRRYGGFSNMGMTVFCFVPGAGN